MYALAGLVFWISLIFFGVNYFVLKKKLRAMCIKHIQLADYGQWLESELAKAWRTTRQSVFANYASNGLIGGELKFSVVESDVVESKVVESNV